MEHNSDSVKISISNATSSTPADGSNDALTASTALPLAGAVRVPAGEIGGAPPNSITAHAERGAVAEQWARDKHKSAVHARLRFVNRTDCYGGYRQHEGTSPPTTHHRTLNQSRLKMHYSVGLLPAVDGKRIATATRRVLGVHAISVNDDCLFAAFDVDNKDKSPAVAAVNAAAVLLMYAALAELGFRPLLVTSNDHGGYHLFVLFDAPVPAEVAYEFGKWFADRWQEFGLPQRPESFPKRWTYKTTSGKHFGGGWIRLPGPHHTRLSFSKVFDGEQWREGDKAIDHMVSLTGESELCMPSHIWERSMEERAKRAAVKNACRVERALNKTARVTQPGEQLPAVTSGAVVGHSGERSESEAVRHARLYIADEKEVPVAVAGCRGHNALLKAARVLVGGFGLTLEAAFPVLAEYSSRCLPPWDDDELLHKLEEAANEDASKPQRYAWLLEFADIREFVNAGGKVVSVFGPPCQPLTPEQVAALRQQEREERLADEARLKGVPGTPEHTAFTEGAAVLSSLDKSIADAWRTWRIDCSRHPDCGRTHDHVFQNKIDRHKLFVATLSCGRSGAACAHCDTINRARSARELARVVLLKTMPLGRRVDMGKTVAAASAAENAIRPEEWRTTPVHVGEIDADDFGAVKKSLQRAAKKGTPRGWLRVRLGAGRLLIVADSPFAVGSKPAGTMTPAQAAALVAKQVMTGDSAAYWLGRSRSWVPIRERKCRDLGAVARDPYDCDAPTASVRELQKVILVSAGVELQKRVADPDRPNKICDVLGFETSDDWDEWHDKALVEQLQRGVPFACPIKEVAEALSQKFYAQSPGLRKEHSRHTATEINAELCALSASAFVDAP